MEQEQGAGSPSRRRRPPAVFWKDHRINIIDTPATSTLLSKSSARCACSMARSFCFDGVAGVSRQSGTVWRQADKYEVPRICFVNKMDRIGADFYRCIEGSCRSPGRWCRSSCRSAPGANSSASSTSSDAKALNWDEEPVLGTFDEFTSAAIPTTWSGHECRATFWIETAVRNGRRGVEKYLEGNDRSKRLWTPTVRAPPIGSVRAGAGAAPVQEQGRADALLDVHPPRRWTGRSRASGDSRDDERPRPTTTAPFSALAFLILLPTPSSAPDLHRVYSGTLDQRRRSSPVKNGRSERIGRIRMHARNDQGNSRRRHHRGGGPGGRHHGRR